MCDTFVSTPETSADGLMILAKNSDREPNEAQNVTFVPAMEHAPGSRVTCTYIDVPQKERTNAVLLSRPFWMFGAEMGVNEHGVAIGNEAVFTKAGYHKKNDALLGMDLMRIALERSKSAREARGCIIELMAAYGQGGVHTMGGVKYYHNSYLIADPEEAHILETAGAHWVSKKVSGIATISNCLTIEEDYDEASPGLEEYARSHGFTGKGKRLNFRRDFSDALFSHFARGAVRRSCSLDLLSRKGAPVTSTDMMRVLRDHNIEEPYRPGERPMERICLHAGGVISSQTTGSMVALLKKDRPPLVYMTGTSAPCMSLYRPHTILKNQKSYPVSMVPRISAFGGIDLYGSSSSSYDEKTLWWKGEEVHRRVLTDYAGLIALLRDIRDPVEKRMIADIEKKWQTPPDADFQKICYELAEALVVEQGKLAVKIRSEYERLRRVKKVPWWFALQWRKNNTKAGMII
jgi:dipeptidase